MAFSDKMFLIIFWFSAIAIFPTFTIKADFKFNKAIFINASAITFEQHFDTSRVMNTLARFGSICDESIFELNSAKDEIHKFVLSGNNTLHLINDKLNFESAAIHCKNMGCELATIDNADSFHHIKNILAQNGVNEVFLGYFTQGGVIQEIGGTQMDGIGLLKNLEIYINSCEHPFKLHKQTCFLQNHNLKDTFFESQKYCQSNNAELFPVNSHNDVLLLLDLISMVQPHSYFWLEPTKFLSLRIAKTLFCHDSSCHSCNDKNANNFYFDTIQKCIKNQHKNATYTLPYKASSICMKQATHKKDLDKKFDALFMKKLQNDFIRQSGGISIRENGSIHLSYVDQEKKSLCHCSEIDRLQSSALDLKMQLINQVSAAVNVISNKCKFNQVSKPQKAKRFVQHIMRPIAMSMSPMARFTAKAVSADPSKIRSKIPKPRNDS